MTHFSAAFFIQAIKDSLSKKYPAEKIEKLLSSLSYFSVEPILSDLPHDVDFTLAVANNLVSRGLPTRMSLNLEKKFIDTFGIFSENEYEKSQGAIGYILDDEPEKYFEALHVIDPRWDKSSRKYSLSWENLGSENENDFLFKSLPKYSGTGDFIIQLIEMQRSITSILENRCDPEKLPEILKQNFRDQACDFSIEFPYPIGEKNGIVIEVDGRQHKPVNQGGTPGQYELDNQRDVAVEKANWHKTLRIPTDQWDNLESKLGRFRELTSNEYFQNMKRNFENKIFDDERLDIFQLTLSPIAIGRIQKTLIEFIIRKVLDLNKPAWKIAVVEQDVPCGYLAIEDFQEMFDNLLSLQRTPIIHLPKIEVQVFSSEEFFLSKLNEPFGNQIKLISEIASDSNEYDLMIDISVLRREGLTNRDTHLRYRNYVEIRSVHSVQSKRTFITAEPIEYAEITRKLKNEKVEPIPEHEKRLSYFLQGIFRKEKFREGQFPILNRALQNQSIIGLLPTGGGKSLTYQLAALLQPGVCLVIDPLKSLMQDQVDGLNRNMIDASVFINSSQRAKEKILAMEKMANGEALFTFITPERLQIEKFREHLKNMAREKHIYFSYFVIDEAHCVSEWGHDFRTAYLWLGKNARKYCKTKNEKPVALFGLTATASFDVLTDIQIELSHGATEMRDEDIIVRIENLNRDELQYEVIPVIITSQDFNQIGNANDMNFEGKRLLGHQKQAEVNRILKCIATDLNNYNNGDPEEIFIDTDGKTTADRNKIFKQIRIENLNDANFYVDSCDHAGLVFCPHRGWYFGVTDKYKNPQSNNGSSGVFDKLEAITGLHPGTFLGSSNDDEFTQEAINKDNIRNQNDFINNRLNLLVCTKAFGMGIDKPNVRFTIHLNYPQSIESFVQESGRAGRDGKMAVSFILYNPGKYPPGKVDPKDRIVDVDYENNLYFHTNSFKGQEKEKAIIWELLHEISCPPDNRISEINEYLEENVEIRAFVSLWKSNAGYWYLFVDEDKDHCFPPDRHRYGTIRLPSLDFDFLDRNMPEEQSEEVLTFIKTYILENCPNIGDVINWLNQNTTQEPLPGIEEVLKTKSDFETTLKFYNDWESIYRQIGRLTNKPIDQVRQAHRPPRKINTRFEDFWEALHVDNGNESKKQQCEKEFNKIRDKADTEKALYRLSILGVIDDYDVDFSKKICTIRGKKHDYDYYQKKLYVYINKYYSDVRAKKEIEKADNWKVKDSDNPLYKYIAYLIDFIYTEVEKKRLTAISDMKAACEKRRAGNNREFKEYIDLYFNSKYARKGYEEGGKNQSLWDRTDEGKKFDINWVWEFIEITQGSRNNLKHLRGACMRMLRTQPDNATMLLLKAFAVILLEADNPRAERLLEEAENDLIKGFNGFQRKDKYTAETLLRVINHYFELMIGYSEKEEIKNLAKYYRNYILIDFHLLWLKEFNNNFLKGMGYDGK